eukprot:CAMPEP_0176018842 /NCGR_PEP_ID=MMETSP0120_2-20121206/9084_1 /TAXON_ID=160619 /ORGANISM="Kryptoperidinium foliaceum, Strain CCMP 1326" /LENGTH=513 /DNA_ID=CAMNT_0017351901 /DNA_START=81 /DNA_END=1622 /DNA_ORIENTATION=-
MPRKSKSNSNPLANARGQQKAPENVWYRRSGAGYRCFVEYYSQQPPGVITPHLTDQDDTASAIEKIATIAFSATTKRQPSEGKKGMSRAAKRRRKKKGGAHPAQISNGDGEGQVDETTPAKAEAPLSEMPRAILDSLLIQAAMSNPRVRSEQLAFFQAMARPLPTTFRIRATVEPSRHEKILREVEALEPQATRIPIAPDLFQLPVAKSQLPQDWKEFLLEKSQSGDLSRQELGSMLPVLVLPLKAGDCVVDMCAVVKDNATLEVVGRSKGLVLANDILESRVKALQEAVERSGIFLKETDFDSIQYSQVDATKLKLSKPCDAVICDVPCSGDGTCRKDPHVLPMWKPQAGNSLHSTQLAILKHFVCYSTCSLNPVEDEAVVAAALKAFEDRVELIEIKGLAKTQCHRHRHRNHAVRHHRPGISDWKVAHYVEGDASDDAETAEEMLEPEDQPLKLKWYETYNAAKDEMKEAVPSIWPYHGMDLPLDRCARLLPQDYDSGGFFVALLKKTKKT